MTTPTNLFARPADVYVGPTGATEPANALVVPSSPFRHTGITGAAATLTIGQSYTDLVGEQSAMPYGAELSEQMTSVTVSFAELTLTNLRTALNQANPTGTSEVQTINLGTATAGSITITFDGQTTGAIAFNASAATVQTALESLSNINPGDVVVTGGPLPATITLTFGGAYAGTDVPQVTVAPTGLTGGTVTVATSTAGAPGPSLGISGRLLNAVPNYSSVLLRGPKPGGGMRHVVVRRTLSTENVALSWKKGEQTFIPVTFKAYYVSDTIDAVFIDDRQS